jgi:hypothetical protein
MVRDEEIERITVEAVTTYEVSRGWQVESVEKDNRGVDLISRKPYSEDPKTAIEVRFIEVKGRAAVGEVALTTNEYKTAEWLKQDYWLYTVFNCASTPKVHVIQGPNSRSVFARSLPSVLSLAFQESLRAGSRSLPCSGALSRSPLRR